MTKLNKTQTAIINNISDDCGTMRAPIDGHRMVMAARKLAEMGYGRFVCESFYDRRGNSSIPTLVSCGHFYPN